jgi:DNA topoisomerase-1
MQKRWSKNGWFLGCSRYPTCKNTRNIDEDGKEQSVPRETIFRCEKCQTGKLLLRKGRFGSFLGCSNYPRCDFTRPVPLGLSCPKCKIGEIIEIKSKKKGGRTFYGCSRYALTEDSCDFKTWQAPVRKGCPACNAPFLVLAGNKKEPALLCINEACGHKESVTPEEVEVLIKLDPPEEIFETSPTLPLSRLNPVLLDGPSSAPMSDPPSVPAATKAAPRAAKAPARAKAPAAKAPAKAKAPAAKAPAKAKAEEKTEEPAPRAPIAVVRRKR